MGQEEKNIKGLKEHLKGWTETQGISLTEKQYELIFDFAESLGINDVGKLTIFYTMYIMPILDAFVRKLKR